MTYLEVAADLHQFALKHGISVPGEGVNIRVSGNMFVMSMLTKEKDSPVRHNAVRTELEVLNDMDRLTMVRKLRNMIIRRHILDINGYYYDDNESNVPNYVQQQVSDAIRKVYR
jgi:hypothetical protein